ncbi:hypothetical protein [Kutzneria chonburiensis]|uniref:SH3 domain-containing protein n=1 Tax=Kutzneria chonburiensis TaxID=1483604 RepID=A0ABV6MY77_9PSEU|nr:hypothetical protein [Kutzneria chonburiensis]
MRPSIAALAVGAAAALISIGGGAVAEAAPAAPASTPATCPSSGSGDVIVTTTTLTVRTGPGTNYAAQGAAVHGGDVLFCSPVRAGGRYTACGHSNANGWIPVYRGSRIGWGYIASTCVSDY